MGKARSESSPLARITLSTGRWTHNQVAFPPFWVVERQEAQGWGWLFTSYKTVVQNVKYCRAASLSGSPSVIRFKGG